MHRAYTTPRSACQLGLIKQLWDHQCGGSHRFICTKDRGGGWHQIALTNWSENTLRQVVDRNSHSDLYFCPHGFDGPTRTSARSVVPRMLYADLDEVNPRTVKPRPTIAWETSPGRGQAIWLLTKEPVDWDINRRLTYAIGADKGGWDMTQVLRIPGSINYKYDGHPVGRLLWNGGDIYDHDEMLAGLPEVGTAAEVQIPRGDLGLLAQRAWRRVRGGLLPIVVEWLSSEKSPKGDRSEPQFFIEQSLREAGATREECYAIVRVQLRWNKFDDDQLWDEVGRVYADESEKPKLCAIPFKLTLQPAREWIYGHDYARGLLSMTSARGGAGKTRLVLAEAAAIVSQVDLLGVKPRAHCNVWYLGEDPREDLDRYIEALVTHHELDVKCLEEHMFVNSMRDGARPVVSTIERDGVKIRQPMVDAICGEIISKRIGIFICDPFIKTYEGIKESDNNAMMQVMNTWTNIAHRTHCSIMLLHHIRKAQPGTNGDVTLDDMRGASGIGDEARIARVLQKGDEKMWGKDHKDYMRCDDAKYTHAKPCDARWYHLVGVTLANGRDNVSTCEFAAPVRVELTDGVMHWKSGEDDDVALDVLAECGPMTQLQWAKVAGVGRQTIRRICKRNGKVTQGQNGLWKVTNH